MQNEKHKISIYYQEDTYEFIIQGNIITRITKCLSDTNMTTDILYQNVPYGVKIKLQQELESEGEEE